MSDYNETPIKFNIYTRAWDPAKEDFMPDSLTASLGSDGRMRLTGTASSTIKDLHGDEIVESGLADMEMAANNNLTIFGNHSYQVPEDVYGSVEAAVLARAVAMTKTGDPVHDLKMSILVNSENDRAIKTWKAISKGTKLGLSIGAMIPEGGAKIDKKSKRLIIEHLDLLETSIVGIPANPRSWVDSARKSYFETPVPVEPVLGNVQWSPPTSNTASQTFTLSVPASATIDEPDVTKKPLEGHERHDLPDSAFACPEKRKYPHHTASGAVDKAHLRSALSRCGDPSNDQCGCAHIRAHAKSLGMGDSDEKSLDELILLAVTSDFDEDHFAAELDSTDGLDDLDVEDVADESEPEVTDAATCPTCGKGKGAAGCSDGYHRGTEPDVLATATETQVAPQSEPSDDTATNSANETVAAALETVVGLDADVTAAFDQMAQLVEKLTSELFAARDAKVAAERQRDAIVAESGEMIAKTQAIIAKLSNLPLGPRAVLVRTSAANDLSALEGVYSRDFLEILRS